MKLHSYYVQHKKKTQNVDAPSNDDVIMHIVVLCNYVEIIIFIIYWTLKSVFNGQSRFVMISPNFAAAWNHALLLVVF